VARSKASASPASPYNVHPAVAMVAKWVAELPLRTGRSLEEWVKLVEKDGPRPSGVPG
jgi:hypothetical protein